jgi:hypothetical protein
MSATTHRLAPGDQATEPKGEDIWWRGKRGPADDLVEICVEIPWGSHNKYGYDPDRQLIRCQPWLKWPTSSLA